MNSISVFQLVQDGMTVTEEDRAMTWGNGSVTITYRGPTRLFDIDISDPDGIASWMLKEVTPQGGKVKTHKVGNGGCQNTVNIKIKAVDINQANRLRVSYVDCQSSPAGEVWLLDPAPAAADPGNPKNGRRLSQGTPLMHDDDEDGKNSSKRD